jgi:hypothetical protein
MHYNFLYVDPSSGSYLIQAIIAAVLGAGFWVKAYWLRIKSFFSGKKEMDKKKEPDASTDLKTNDMT